MNILFVCEVDWCRKVVFGMHLLAESMALLGHKIYVIDYESMWERRNGRMLKETMVSRVFPNAFVHLVRPSFVRIPVLSRVSAFATHHFEIRRVIEEKQIDAVILYSVPTNGLQAVHWAKRFNIPIVFRSIDVLHHLVPYPVLSTITKMLERKVYSSVDRILAISPKLLDYAIGLGADVDNVDILPMPVDTNTFCPSNDVEEIRGKWGLRASDKVVLFMGTLFPFSGLDTFLLRFEQMLRYVPNAKLLIVGDGAQRRQLKRIIDTLSLKDYVTITGFQPYQDMPKYINLADVCINTFVDNAITRDIFPGKIVQFLACSKPLVMRPLEGVKAVISGEKQGVVYADDDRGIMREVVSLLNDSKRRSHLGQNGLEYARRFHSCEFVARQLEVILESMIKERAVV